MSIKVEWFDREQTIIRQTVCGEFTWDEFYAQNQVIQTMIASVPHLVCLLVDVRESSMRTARTGIMTHIRLTAPNFPDNLTQIVVIANNIFFISLVKMIQLLGITGPQVQIHTVHSMSDAQIFLDKTHPESRRDTAV